jgi:hypothetical protein
MDGILTLPDARVSFGLFVASLEYREHDITPRERIYLTFNEPFVIFTLGFPVRIAVERRSNRCPPAECERRS